MKKRLLAILLLLVILALSSCTQERETTGTSVGNESRSGDSEPMWYHHLIYDLESFEELRSALFDQEAWIYNRVRLDIHDRATKEPRKICQPYARMLEQFERTGTYPMPYVGGKSYEQWYLEKNDETSGTVASIHLFVVDNMVQYNVYNHSLSWSLPMIRYTPLDVEEDPKLQEYENIISLAAGEGWDLKGWKGARLNLADRSVPALYTPFSNGRYMYVFLYDGARVSVTDTPDVLTEEFWSGFSIEMVAKT